MISERFIKIAQSFRISLQNISCSDKIAISTLQNRHKTYLALSNKFTIFAPKNYPIMITTTADKIRAQIKLHGLTQTEVANILGMYPANLSRLINSPRITLADLNKLANVIGCNVAEFFMDDYTPTQPPTLTCPHCGKEIHIELK
jgi:DNA-binding Xre family transcriptional regulator